MTYPLLLCAGALALICYIREKVRAYTLRAVLLKSLVSTVFLAVGIYGAYRSAGAAGPSPRGRSSWPPSRGISTTSAKTS